MESDLVPGCTLSISFCDREDLKMQFRLSDAINWLTLNSGLSKNYTDKILSVAISQRLTIEIKFDSTVNCFEAMQQIKSKVMVYTYANNSREKFERVQFSSMTCPCGGFVKVTVRYFTFDELEMKPLVAKLDKYGFILNMNRTIDTDSDSPYDNCEFVELLMFVQEGSPLLNKEWVAKKIDKLKVQQYIPNTHVTNIIETPIVDRLWDMFGYFSNDNSEESENDEVKDLEQVD